MATIAKRLNFQADYLYFQNQSQFYKVPRQQSRLLIEFQNVWNNETKVFCPKTIAGKWECPTSWINVFDERYTGKLLRLGLG